MIEVIVWIASVYFIGALLLILLFDRDGSAHWRRDLGDLGVSMLCVPVVLLALVAFSPLLLVLILLRRK